MESRRPYSGLVTGSMIAIAFGLVFVLVNAGPLATPWSAIVRVVGIVLAVVLAIATFRVGRVAPPPVASDGGGFASRGYWLIVVAEAVALFGGLAVVNGVFHRGDLGVCWVAVVVGVHFFGLARLWRMPRHAVLGGVMTLLGLAGFVLGGLGAGRAWVALVSGVGCGLALFAAAAAGLRHALSERG